MDPYANAGCVLKMNVKCETCIAKLMEALTSICGVYTINIDAEKGLVHINGQVDPNTLLSTLFSSGEHAELLSIKLQHPALGGQNSSSSSSYHLSNNINNVNAYGSNYGRLTSGLYNNTYNNNDGISYSYGINEPYLYDRNYNCNDGDSYGYGTRMLLGDNYDDRPSYNYQSSPSDYNWDSRYHAYDPLQPLPLARYVPSGPPPPEYNTYDDEPLSLCTIL